MPSTLTFADARAHSEGRTRSVLLGNGFSIDYAPDTFRYGALADEAQFPDLSVDKSALFRSVESEDFEVLVERLRMSARLASAYADTTGLAARMDADADIVRTELVRVLARRHPASARVLSAVEVHQARTFLSSFHEVFTLNYDLLLYWVVSRTRVAPPVPAADGFGKTQNRLLWDPANPQHVHHLHGGLHLFVDELGDLTKLSSRRGGTLVNQLRTRLEAGEYPLIVSEGTRREKQARIRRSPYLTLAHQRFAELEGALFLHGVSMSANDDHVFDTIAARTSRVSAVYVGLHGEADSPSCRGVKARIRALVERRDDAGGTAIDVHFYDATTAHVWR